MSPPRLTFAGVIGGYGTAPVVREVSGQVARGEVLCVLGRNGTGKTTLMRLLMGYLPAGKAACGSTASRSRHSQHRLAACWGSVTVRRNGPCSMISQCVTISR